MRYIFITISLFYLLTGFAQAASHINGGHASPSQGGPAQILEQNVLQPKPDYSAPNVSGNANFQTSLGQEESSAPSSSSLAGQSKTADSQNGLSGLGAGHGSGFWPVAWVVLTGLIAALVWRSLNNSKDR